MNDWINLAVCGKLMDYLFIKSLLESKEIQLFVENENTFYLNPLMNDQNDHVYLYVHKTQYQEAKKLLVEYGYKKYLRD